LVYDQRARSPGKIFSISDRDRELVRKFSGKGPKYIDTTIEPTSKLGWLVGIIDAEGSFIFTDKNLLFNINMACEFALEKISEYLKTELGITSIVYDKNVKYPSKLKQFYIHLRNDSLESLVTQITPLLITKNLQSSLILEYMQNRIPEHTSSRLVTGLNHHLREAREESLKILKKGNPVPS